MPIGSLTNSSQLCKSKTEIRCPCRGAYRRACHWPDIVVEDGHAVHEAVQGADGHAKGPNQGELFIFGEQWHIVPDGNGFVAVAGILAAGLDCFELAEKEEALVVRTDAHEAGTIQERPAFLLALVRVAFQGHLIHQDRAIAVVRRVELEVAS